MVLTFMVKGADRRPPRRSRGSRDRRVATPERDDRRAGDTCRRLEAVRSHVAASTVRDRAHAHAARDRDRRRGRSRRHAGDVDVRRPGARPDPAGKVGDLFTVTLVNDGKVGPLDRLPCEPSRVERRDAHDRARRVARVPVQGRLRGHLHVPLRNGAGASPHRQRDVRRDHHRPARRSLRSITSTSSCNPELVPRARGSTRRSHQDAERRLGRSRLQRLLEPVQVRADPSRGERAHPRVGARRGTVGELVVPHRRHDLRHRVLRGQVRSCVPTRPMAARRHWASSRRKEASSSSASPRTVCIRS